MFQKSIMKGQMNAVFAKEPETQYRGKEKVTAWQ